MAADAEVLAALRHEFRAGLEAPTEAEPESMAYLTNVYVRPTARGAGIGSRLLAEALDWCRASGADCALLRPTERSRPLYERHGFAPATRLMEVPFDGESPDDRAGLPGGA